VNLDPTQWIGSKNSCNLNLLILLLLSQLLLLLQLLGVHPPHGVLGRLQPDAVRVLQPLRLLVRGQLTYTTRHNIGNILNSLKVVTQEVLWIRIGFNVGPDPGPSFYLNADPDPGQI
jgi:hypothetical protein